MCRLMAYIGAPILAADLVTKPSRSIITQSFDARERLTEIGYLNGDGFGIGWYTPEVIDPAPCVFRSVTPAWNNANLYNLSRKIVSPIIFAHVRAATPGDEVQELNCHPFHSGRYMFMHNGMVARLDRIRRPLMAQLSASSFEFAVKHSSDSGLCFAILLDEIGDHNAVLNPDLLRKKVENMVKRVWDALDDAQVIESSLLNFVVSDGAVIIATRVVRDPTKEDAVPASLYIASGAAFQCRDEKSGDFRMIQSGRNNYAAIIASEPITDDSTDWLPIQKNHITVILGDLHVLSSPLDLPNPGHNYAKAKLPRYQEISLCLQQLTSFAKRESSSSALNLMPYVIKKELKRSFESESCKNILKGHTDTILSIAIKGDRLYSGSQDTTIGVWDLNTYTCVHSIQAHDKGVLFLIIEGNTLISSSSDRTIKIWNLETLECIGSCPSINEGPMFSLCVVDGMLYQGCQDGFIYCTPLLSIHKKNRIRTQSTQEMRENAIKGHFKSPDDDDTNKFVPNRLGGHCGFVYGLKAFEKYLVSASGDSSIKVWNRHDKYLKTMLLGHHGGVHDLVIDDDTREIFSGSSDCTIKMWDIDSFSCRRTLLGHSSPVLSLALSSTMLFSGCTNGIIIGWSRSNYESTVTLSCGTAINSLRVIDRHLIGGFNDNVIGLWDTSSEIFTSGVDSIEKSPLDSAIVSSGATKNGPLNELDSALSFQEILSSFISIKSISSDPAYYDECWQAAKFLSALIDKLGGNSILMAPIEGSNPVVCAKIGNDENKPTILMYGHYDVQPVVQDLWQSDPWTLLAINDFFYGRGTSDDKGPILSCIYAVFELLNSGDLPVNVLFVYEGEVEKTPGSNVLNHLFDDDQSHEWFQNVDFICVCNNYWIGEDRPCLTYGMRGSLNVEVSIDGFKRNLHSGVDGGVVVEPLTDLLGIFASLIDGRGMVLIPGFYDGVEAVTEKELLYYEDIDFDLDAYKSQLGVLDVCTSSAKDTLMSRWREPSLSVTGVYTNVSHQYFTIIPKSATGHIAIRYVPNQKSEDLVRDLTAHLRHEFAKRHSPNKLSVRVVFDGSWWLGKPESLAFQAAAKAIEEVWGVKPMFVREGGTMATTSFLEDKFKAPAIHIPLGASSCNAHLANERIGISNLRKGKEVLKKFFFNISETWTSKQ